ncbi:MAG: RelA/SpoT family protein [bacterium]|nr:RelA/SpoT family protein [bacterium]
MTTIQDVLAKAKEKRKNVDELNITRAYEFAKTAHATQKRKSGEPFITHPTSVALIVAEMGLDNASIMAALLHDVVEDTSLPIEEIELLFGKDVAFLVAGETNLGHLKFISDQEEYRIENLRKMLLAMARDVRVVLLKLADRLHNLRTMKYMPPQKRISKSKETLEIYAPLASRLGMGQMRGELEDLAFQWVYPKEYEEIKQLTHTLFKEGDRYVAIVKRKLQDALKKEEIPATLEGRAKHLYSLWKKLQRPEINNDILKIPDLIAVRVIIEQENIEKCYIVLGLVHQLWTPVAGRVSDYIATPKANGYQSLHTKVFVEQGKIMEVQIRTRKMHEQAEFGIASHVIYEQNKQIKGAKNKDIDEGFKASQEQLNWIKELTRWQKEEPDSEGFLKGLKTDLFKDRIFVYTPEGEVKDLPMSATPIDFAYAVHTQIGNKAIGARIDGHIVPLNYQLRSGEICEIIVSKEKKYPSTDWLRFVVTNNARKNIQKFMSAPVPPKIEVEEEEENKEEQIEPKRMQDFPEIAPSSYLQYPLSLLNKVQNAFKTKIVKKSLSTNTAVIVHGIKGVATRIAKCCTPLPGEEIVGFVTQDQVVSVHRANCTNVSQIFHKEKQIPVAWHITDGITRAIRIKIEMEYREGALRDITKILSDTKVPIEQFEQLPASEGILKMQCVVGIDNEAQKQLLYSRLHKVKGVQNIE